MVFMPPRHGKSTVISHHFPAWYLGRNPDKRVILASYQSSFATEWGFKAQELLKKFGPTVFGVKPSQELRARDAWGIKEHEGRMFSVGVNAAITGKGGDVIIVDDPIKSDKEAMSESIRASMKKWFSATLYTRLEPGASMIILQTRWHEDDLSGWILNEMKENGGEKWEVVNFPAIAEDNDDLGRAVGEPLCPERFDAEALGRIEKTLGSLWYRALYQQKPSMDEGNIFKSQLFKYYQRQGDQVLYGSLAVNIGDLRRFATVDLAFTEAKPGKDPDWTVIAVWGATSDKLFLLDIIRFREDIYNTVPHIYAANKKWRLAEVWVESNGFGTKVIEDARKRHRDMRIRELVADRDKMTRALAAYPYFEDGTIIFPAAAVWLKVLVKELLSFPNAQFDDQVDAISYGPLVAGVGKRRPFDSSNSESMAEVLDGLRTRRPA